MRGAGAPGCCWWHCRKQLSRPRTSLPTTSNPAAWGRRRRPHSADGEAQGRGAIWVRPAISGREGHSPSPTASEQARLAAARAWAVCPLPEASVPTAVTTGLAHEPPEASSTPSGPQGHGLASTQQAWGPSVPGRSCLRGRRGPPPDSDTVGAVVLGSGALRLAEQAVISWWQTLGTALIPGWRDGWGRRPLPARLLTACAGHVTPPDSLVTGLLGSGPPGLDPCPLS